jgi:hypothetical protein
VPASRSGARRARRERGALNEKEPLRTQRLSTGATGLEPATSGVTGRRSNQLSYAPGRGGQYGTHPGAGGGDPQLADDAA